MLLGAAYCRLSGVLCNAGWAFAGLARRKGRGRQQSKWRKLGRERYLENERERQRGREVEGEVLIVWTCAPAPACYHALNVLFPIMVEQEKSALVAERTWLLEELQRAREVGFSGASRGIFHFVSLGLGLILR